MDATLDPTLMPRVADRAAIARQPQPVTAPAARPQPGEHTGRSIHRTIREDGICVLTFDRPNSSANVFDRATLEELRDELDCVSNLNGLTGLILASAKRSIFIAGLDLHSIGESASPEEIRDLVRFGQSQIHRVAELGIPTAAAIHGAAMGGGCEIALACDYRIASADRKTKIGLPEIQLGLLPAWGGATRLPRLIGLPKALGIILAGKTLAAKPARKLGLVDDLAPAENLVEVAARKIREGKPRRPSHWMTNNPLSVAVISARLRSQMLKRTRGNYPAIMKSLEVMTRGISHSISDSLELELEGVLDLVQTPACRNLLRLFFLQDHAKKRVIGPRPEVEPRAVLRTAVIGAGVMGAGVAQWLSARGLPVILRDVNTEQVAKGMATIGNLYQQGVKRHVLTPLEARAGMDRIHPAPNEVPLRNVDLVIEAAVENLDLKKRIFAQLEALTREDAVLATNTSALPVSELAASLRHPERVVGLHFFNPVHRMQLVEIIAARQTSPEVLLQAIRFTQRIGKLPVVVKDSPGFLVNRILMPYLLEARNLFEAGAKVTDLDEAMLDFGMPMGPMRLLDEVGMDVARHVGATLASHFGERMQTPVLIDRMVEAKLLGRKTGKGFYTYDTSKNPKPNAELSTHTSDDHARGLSRKDLQQRMVCLMVNEAARCLQEEIVTDPADVDFAMVMGTGFAPFRGGPLRYADQLGVAKLAGTMEQLASGGAVHFTPCDLIRRHAANGTTFYKG